MGVEFKLSRNDHKKVEDFLARRPAGVAAITIDAHLTRYQAAAAEAARATGVEVLIEPLTERLADPGFEPAGLPYHTGDPIAIERLHQDTDARRELAEQVVAAQDLATIVVPAHFYVHDDRSADLNLRLAQRTIPLAARRPIRPILVVKRKYALARCTELAHAYVDLGVEAIELRVTPLGGDDESVQKIRSVSTIATAFRMVGLNVVLGCSGNIGQTALALGHINGFSVGIGVKEKIDHASAINRQGRPPDDDEDDHHHFGPQAGVYLPGPAATVRRAVAQAMLAERDIRTRIGCRTGRCANDIAGPAADPREHYLHARADEVAQLVARPPAWRPTMEADRLQRALDLREMINNHYLPDGAHPLKTRTLRSLIEGIERQQRMSA